MKPESLLSFCRKGIFTRQDASFKPSLATYGGSVLRLTRKKAQRKITQDDKLPISRTLRMGILIKLVMEADRDDLA